MPKKPSMRRLMALGLMLPAVQACAPSPVISAPPPACSNLLPDEWANGIKHAPAPVQPSSEDILDRLKAWIGFGIAEAANVETANARARDAIGIVKRCEERDAAAVKRSRHKVLGLF